MDVESVGDCRSIWGFRAVTETQEPKGVCSCNVARVSKTTLSLLYGKLGKQNLKNAATF